MDTNESVNPDLPDLEQFDEAGMPAVDVRPVGPVRAHLLPARWAYGRTVGVTTTTNPDMLEQIAAEDLRRRYIRVCCTGQSVYIGHDKQMVADGVAPLLPAGVMLTLETSAPLWVRAAAPATLAGAAVATNVTAGDPPAGGEITFGTPSVVSREVTPQSIKFTLVTSAVAANRRVQLLFEGPNPFPELFRVIAPIDQTASQTITYEFVAGAGVEWAAARNGHLLIPLPPALRLETGCRIRTITAAIDAGDNYSAPIMGYVDTPLSTTPDALVSYWSANWAD